MVVIAAIDSGHCSMQCMLGMTTFAVPPAAEHCDTEQHGVLDVRHPGCTSQHALKKPRRKGGAARERKLHQSQIACHVTHVACY